MAFTIELTRGVNTECTTSLAESDYTIRWRTPMDKVPSRRVTYEASVCNVVLDVHVKRYDMCMWDSTTCASRTALHVHLKQDCAPRKGTFFSEKDKE